MKKHAIVLIICSLIGLTSGCQTTQPVESAGTEQTFVPFGTDFSSEVRDIRLIPEMDASALLQALGEPDDRKLFPNEDPPSLIWIYEDFLFQTQDEVMVDVVVTVIPAAGGGQTARIEEPVFETQTLDTFRVTELLIQEDKLISWRQQQISRQRITN